ncbi:MAG: hypothetical protein EKK47_02535 [Burkholderiales bacterium]|jgi:hypothetical protein|nr:MAG: hypothetical protein EKK47_02535 [Burkholderiales bacterium]
MSSTMPSNRARKDIEITVAQATARLAKLHTDVAILIRQVELRSHNARWFTLGWSLAVVLAEVGLYAFEYDWLPMFALAIVGSATTAAMSFSELQSYRTGRAHRCYALQADITSEIVRLANAKSIDPDVHIHKMQSFMLELKALRH